MPGQVIPRFPDDVQTAPLVRLSLAKLLAHDAIESERLYEASKTLGFFYLDLQDAPSGRALCLDADALFQVGEQLFMLGSNELQKYNFQGQGSYMGYKGFGANVQSKDGARDRNEFYNVSKDDVLGVSKRPWPEPQLLKQRRSLLSSFIREAHNITILLLDLLDTHLGLAHGTLAGLHRLTKPSGDQVRFIKAPPQPLDDRQVALGQHTDFGSVTVLFNRLGGLQVLTPGDDSSWRYVRPLPGHAVINLGDAIVKFTHGLLRSNLHRVVSPPGAQAELTRYSLVYFSRPEDDVLLRRLEGSSVIPVLADGEVEEVITANDWINRRGLSSRAGIYNGDFERMIRGTETVQVAKL